MNEVSNFTQIVDTSLRVKVNNNCQWACRFCHNEGTEVPVNQKGRVSIFLSEPTFDLPPVGEMPYTQTLMRRFDFLKDIGINEIHLTGGEPTLHSDLPKIVRNLTLNGFIVKMTSNGQVGAETIRELAEGGLKGVAFSMISFDPEEFLRTQKAHSVFWANKMIEREKQSILLARELGIDVKINTVVLSKDDYPRVDSVRKFAQANGIRLALLKSLGDGKEAQEAVFDYANNNGSYLSATESTNNGKGTLHYILADGTHMDVKYLRPYHPEVVCGSCIHKDQTSCAEKFYGPRMEFRDGDPFIRLCIQQSNERTIMPLMTFLEKDIFKSFTELPAV